MKRTGRVLGVIFIVLGTIALLRLSGIVPPSFMRISLTHIINMYWPVLFLVLPGTIFHLRFFTGSRNNPGLLVPGGILLVLGAVFQFNMLFGGWNVMWPFYIFAIAFGLFELYVFGPGQKGLLVPIGILGGLSLIFFISFSAERFLNYNIRPFVLPCILIVAGSFILFGGRPDKRR